MIYGSLTMGFAAIENSIVKAWRRRCRASELSSAHADHFICMYSTISTVDLS
jgi:hypothetical protein